MNLLEIANLLWNYSPREVKAISPGELAVMLAAQNAADRVLWTLKDLKEDLNMPQATASEHQARLIEKGYLARARCDFDHRQYHLTLTPTGHRALRSARIWSES